VLTGRWPEYEFREQNFHPLSQHLPGKYTLQVPHEVFFATGIVQNGFGVLPIEPRHTALVATLPFHHKDPFDRLLASQALADNLTLVSADAIFDTYGIVRQW
jgi:PIN domain nuclease of toxin-antitoxin system